MEKEFKIKGLMMDPVTNAPIVILQDLDETNLLPIWVGIFEANAIALQIERIDTPRPMTHDLLKNVLVHMGAQIKKIVVTELKENTFYAMIHLDLAGQPTTVDSRPSDAIALALRTRRPHLRHGTGHRQQPKPGPGSEGDRSKGCAGMAGKLESGRSGPVRNVEPDRCLVRCPVRALHPLSQGWGWPCWPARQNKIDILPGPPGKHHGTKGIRLGIEHVPSSQLKHPHTARSFLSRFPAGREDTGKDNRCPARR